MSRRTELIVALDVPDEQGVCAALDGLPPDIRWYKVGLELFSALGPDVIALLRGKGKQVFLDLKLHDIPNTVASAIRSIAAHDVQLLTVHAAGGRAMLQAAATATREHNGPRLIAVTTLTSLSEEDLHQCGIERTIEDQALALGSLALDAGIDGLVCSPLEVGRLRSHFGPNPVLVTPGIRLAGDEVGDQKRIATPIEAARQGASFIVVGRSLLNSPDPSDTAQRILTALKSVDITNSDC